MAHRAVDGKMEEVPQHGPGRPHKWANNAEEALRLPRTQGQRTLSNRPTRPGTSKVFAASRPSDGGP
jgi:hypothetical protein